MSSIGTLHVLYSLRAEGCPRLALGLIEQELLAMPHKSAVAVCSEDNADLQEDFAQLGVPIYSLQWRRRSFVGLVYRSFRLMRELQPQRVICYTLGLHVSMAAAARQLNLPFIVHLGCAPPVDNRTALTKLRVQLRIGDPLVSRYACCSEYVRQTSLAVYRLPAEKVVTIPNGIPLARFAASASRSAPTSSHGPQRPLVVGMVGSLEASKDHPTLLRAIKILSDQGHDVSLRLIGGGSQQAALQALAQTLGIATKITWVGTVKNVSAELAHLDVFAYSVLAGEGLGIALIEALAAGLPTVASDVGACREVLENGQLGQLVEAGNPAAMAAALLTATSFPAAPHVALQRYDIRHTARCYAEIFTATP